jgi:hypothetical protein
VVFRDPTVLDCKDQVEVLAAVTILDSRLGTDPTPRWNEVCLRLSKLPAGVANIMRRTNFAADLDGNPFELRQ